MNNEGPSLSGQYFYAESFDPRVTGYFGAKGVIWLYIPESGAPALLQKQDDGFSTNWVNNLPGGGTVTSVGSGTGLTGGPITTTGSLSIANTGVAAATYGSASSVAVVAVNAQGQITSATSTAIAISASQVTSGIFTVAQGGTGVGTFTPQSVIFMGATTLAEDNADFKYNSTTKVLALGDQTLFTGDTNARLRAINDVNDPTNAVESGVVSYSEGTFSASSVSSIIGSYNVAKIYMGPGFTLSGGLVGTYSAVSRAEATDEGVVGIAAGYASTFVSGGSATKVTTTYAAYLAGFHSIDANANQVVSMYDFYAQASSIAAGAVTNRYGVYIEPDTNYTKQSWLSGLNLLGGTVFSAPTEACDVDGNLRVRNLTLGSIPYVSTSGLIAQDNARFFWDATNFRLGIGTTTPAKKIDVVGESSTSEEVITLRNFNNSATSLAATLFFKARGTIATPTAIQSGDIMGAIGALGHDGTSFTASNQANMTFISSEIFTPTAKGTEISLSTTANGTITRKVRARINNDGALQLNGDTSGNIKIYPAAVTTTYSVILPAAQGAANTTLSNDGSGNLTWSSPASLFGFTAGSVIFSNGTILTQNNAKFFWDDTNFRLGINTTAPNRLIHVVDETANSDGVRIENYNNTITSGGIFSARKALGTVATPLAVTAGTFLGSINVNGYNGTAFQTTSPAQVSFVTTETFSTTAAGTDIRFFTTPTGTITRLRVAQITNDGAFELGSGTNAIKIYPGVATANYSIRMPTAQGAAGTYLGNDGSGTLSWTSPTTAFVPFTSVQDLAASATITVTTTSWENYIFVSGAGAPITINTTTGLTNGTMIGQKVILQGEDNTDTVTVTSAGNVFLKGGSAVLAGLSILTLIWTGTTWNELYRSI